MTTPQQDIQAIRDALEYAGELQQFSVTKPLEALAALEAKLSAPMKSSWIEIKTIDDLPKKETLGYEQYDCLVFIKGDIEHLVWNCEHLCWDDRSGDDYACDALEPSHYLIWQFPTIHTDSIASKLPEVDLRGLVEEVRCRIMEDCLSVGSHYADEINDEGDIISHGSDRFTDIIHAAFLKARGEK